MILLLEYQDLSCSKVRENKTQEKLFLKSHPEVYYPYLFRTHEM